jgi:hypothetical protein
MMAPIMRSGAVLAIFLISGCADGLVYGERTSFNLASVRLNDDPAEPVVIKLGFDRDVVLVAPPIGGEVVEKVVEDGQTYDRITAGGEAVSQFSTFTMKSTAPFLNPTEAADLLAVQTRFASGEAALAIAGEPEVVAPFLGLGVGSEITREDLGAAATARRDAMYDAIASIDGSSARSLAAMPPAPMDPTFLAERDPRDQRSTDDATARRVLNGWVSFMPSGDFAEWEAALGIR